MKGKFVAFVTVSALLVAAIHSSITPFAFGAISCVGGLGPGGADQICSTTEGGKTKKVEYCYVDSKGNPICITVYQAAAGSAIAPDLRSALQDTELETAIQDTQNTTKVPKGLLNDGGALSNDNEDEGPDVSPGDDNEDEGPDVSP